MAFTFVFEEDRVIIFIKQRNMEEQNITITKRSNEEILGFQPTREQEKALENIVSFLSSDEKNTFILTGAAGTGKTSIVRLILEYLKDSGMTPVLLAPTGRAANILTLKTDLEASTIHSSIYLIEEIKDENGEILYIHFIRREKPEEKPMVFFVDEASMVGDRLIDAPHNKFVADAPLLKEFISYVRRGHENNKIIFIGDPYQLPPVGMNFSPALSETYLAENYDLRTNSYELTEVKRQNDDSYILENATKLREAIVHGMVYDDIYYEKMGSEEEAIEKYAEDLLSEDPKSSIFLAWKNVSVNILNNRIRKILYNTTKPLVKGERIILDQGNYHGTYIPAGTFLEVDEILNDNEVISGFNFATVKLRYPESGKVLDQEFKIFLGYLNSGQGNRRWDKNMSDLWHERYRVNKELRKTRNKNSDEYLSALKVKYAYAITTHKAQGGEWDKVYLHPELPFGPTSLQWLYTTVTRARKQLLSYSLDQSSEFGLPGIEYLSA